MQFATRSSLIIRILIVNTAIDESMEESKAHPRCVFLKKCALFLDARCYLHDLEFFYQKISGALTVFPYHLLL